MYYGNIKTYDIADGEGVRVSLFVSGCTNGCKGCFQPETWDFKFGKPYTKEVEDGILEELSEDWYQGLTVLGGEPFELQNQEAVAGLIKRVRNELPKKDIWMYTGFTYHEDLLPGGCRYTEFTDEILDNIDILVDGKFIQEKANITLNFRGSENQRIIDMKATREKGEVVLSRLNNEGY